MSQLISIGQLIDQSWENFRQRWRELLHASVWLLIPGVLSIISTALQPVAALETETTVSLWQTVGTIIGSTNNLLVTPIIGLWIFIFCIKIISTNTVNKTNLPSLAKTSWRLFLPTIFINFLVFLLFVATWLLVTPGLLINWLGATFNFLPITIIGALALIIGIVAATILTFCWVIDFTFAPFFLVIANNHGKQALKNSRVLISGRFWSTAMRIFIPKIAFLSILMVIEVVINLILAYLAIGIAGLNTELLTKLETIGLFVSIILGSIISVPLLTMVDYLLFRSLQESKK